MANSKNTNTKEPFKPTFRKVANMTDSEKECFRQGCKTVENKVKQNLGFKAPKK